MRNIISFNKGKAMRGTFKRATIFDFIKLVFLLRKNKYNLFIDPRGDSVAALIGFLSGIDQRIGFAKEEVGGFLYTTRLTYDPTQHEIEKYYAALDILQIKKSHWSPQLFLTEQEKENAIPKISEIQNPFVAIHAGAGATYKIWPTEKWIPIINFLQKKGFVVVLVGGKEDLIYTNKIVDAFKGDVSLHNLTGKLSLREVYFLISKCHLFLGNDSVLGHFAGALNVPAIIVMNGLVDKNRWRPLGNNVRVIVGKNPKHHCTYDRCHYLCPHMISISSDAVLTEVENLIG